MSLKKGHCRTVQVHFTLGHVRTYEKLHITNYNNHQIKTFAKVANHMAMLKEKGMSQLPHPLVKTIDDTYIAIGHVNIKD